MTSRTREAILKTLQNYRKDIRTILDKYTFHFRSEGHRMPAYHYPPGCSQWRGYKKNNAMFIRWKEFSNPGLPVIPLLFLFDLPWTPSGLHFYCECGTPDCTNIDHYFLGPPYMGSRIKNFRDVSPPRYGLRLWLHASWDQSTAIEEVEKNYRIYQQGG